MNCRYLYADDGCVWSKAHCENPEVLVIQRNKRQEDNKTNNMCSRPAYLRTDTG